MAIVSLSTLLSPITRDQALESLIEVLDGLGFNATSWQEGSTQRTFLQMVAEAWSQVTLAQAYIATFGFNELAEGPALTSFSASQYDNARLPAITTQGEQVLTDSGAGGPYTITLGQLVSSDENGVKFRNVTTGTIPLSGTLTLTFEAEIAGTSGNIPTDSTLSLDTPLVGVDVTNPAIATTTSWVSRSGVDQESDINLRERNRTKWFQQNQITKPADAYINLTLGAVDGSSNPIGITRVGVDATNPRGPGSLDVIVADATGPASPTQVSDLQTYLDARKAPTADVLVRAAVSSAIAVTGTVYLSSSTDTPAKRAEIEDSIHQATIPAGEDPSGYFNIIPIGGDDLGTGADYVLFSRIIEQIMAISGVESVSLTSPTGDTLLAVDEIPVAAFSLTYTELS